VAVLNIDYCHLLNIPLYLKIIIFGVVSLRPYFILSGLFLSVKNYSIIPKILSCFFVFLHVLPCWRHISLAVTRLFMV